MKSAATTEKRRSDRLSLSLPAVVKVKENKETHWKEETELVSMSRSGAGFYLNRRCEVGQLVSLMTSIPRHMRGYDEDKEFYRVWGLVQHCSKVLDGAGGYHVGVAFVGKYAPDSYNADPCQSYRICGINADGLWNIVEAERPFVIRRYPRFYASLEVALALFDANDEIAFETEAVTENISLRGAAVFSDLNVNTGDCVRFTCKKFDFSVLSIVRNRQSDGNDLHRLHLEFVTTEFPIKDLNFPHDASQKFESEKIGD